MEERKLPVDLENKESFYLSSRTRIDLSILCGFLENVFT